MTKSWVQAPTDQSGKKLETETFTTSAGTVIHRDVVQIGGVRLANIATVGTVSPSSSATGVFVRWTPPNVQTYEYLWTAAKTNATVITVGAATAVAISQAMVMIDEACTVGVGFRVGFGAASTPTTAGVILSHPGMVPGGIVSRGDGSGVIGIGAAGEDIRITSEVATGGTARLVLSYYEIGS